MAKKPAKHKYGTELAVIQGRCKWCSEPLTGRVKYGPKFCNDGCQQSFERNTGSPGKQGRPKGTIEPQHVAIAKQLVFDELYDPIRDTLREEVRHTITQHVKDNVLGMTELMSDLLPLVLAGIARDVQSEDVFVRQKAQALILKYVMPLQHETPASDDSRVINVVHHVPIPDTRLGYDVEAELVMLPPNVEAFEADWPTCNTCNERKHPDTGDYLESSDPTSDWMCRACNYREQIRSGRMSTIDPADGNVSLMGDA